MEVDINSHDHIHDRGRKRLARCVFRRIRPLIPKQFGRLWTGDSGALWFLAGVAGFVNGWQDRKDSAAGLRGAVVHADGLDEWLRIALASQNALTETERVKDLPAASPTAADHRAVLVRVEKLLSVCHKVLDVFSNDGAALATSGLVRASKANWRRGRRKRYSAPGDLLCENKNGNPCLRLLLQSRGSQAIIRLTLRATTADHPAHYSPRVAWDRRSKSYADTAGRNNLASAPAKSRRVHSSTVASRGVSFRRSAWTSIMPLYRKKTAKLNSLFRYEPLRSVIQSGRFENAWQILLASYEANVEVNLRHELRSAG